MLRKSIFFFMAYCHSALWMDDPQESQSDMTVPAPRLPAGSQQGQRVMIEYRTLPAPVQ